MGCHGGEDNMEHEAGEALKAEVFRGDESIFIGGTAAVQKMRRLISRIRNSDCRVLITGESGTGKEVVARAIWRTSGRHSKKFRAENCAAFPADLIETELFGHVRGSFTGAVNDKRGIVEEVNQGTLFLDEVSSMSLPFQAKVLRFLEGGKFRQVGGVTDHAVDVRLIAATSIDLHDLIEVGEFRADLYYRLAVMCIHIPPLRERKDDIPLLVQHFLGNGGRAISPEALELLSAYHWPGNVRELQNVLERASIFSDGQIGKEEIAASLEAVEGSQREELRLAEDKSSECKISSAPHEYPDRLRTAVLLFEKEHILRVFKKSGGWIKATASLLGVDAATLSRKLKGAGVNTHELRKSFKLEEKERIRTVLHQSKGDILGAACVLGWDPATLRFKMRTYGFKHKDLRVA